MNKFKLNRTNDAVFKAVFAKHPDITLALINAFFDGHCPIGTRNPGSNGGGRRVYTG